MAVLVFFYIREFLIAQRCTWILRAKKNCIDNWRYDVHDISPNNNPLLIRSSDVNTARNPIIFGFAQAYEYFLEKFSGKGKSYQNGYLFENSFFQDPLAGGLININFFGREFYNNYMIPIRALKYSNCFNAIGFKTLNDFRTDGLPLTAAQWMRLRGACTRARQNAQEDGFLINSTIENFTIVWKKGGKKLREIIGADRILNNPVQEMRTFITHTQLISAVPVDTRWISG
jgi:hypothetical protein